MLCERTQKLRIFFIRKIQKRTESCDIYGRKARHTQKKNEIGNPFRGSLSHLFVGTVLQQPLLILFYIFSGTLILNMVSTLKITFFTPMHRARRACCTAGSAPLDAAVAVEAVEGACQINDKAVDAAGVVLLSSHNDLLREGGQHPDQVHLAGVGQQGWHPPARHQQRPHPRSPSS